MEGFLKCIPWLLILGFGYLAYQQMEEPKIAPAPVQVAAVRVEVPKPPPSPDPFVEPRDPHHHTMDELTNGH